MQSFVLNGVAGRKRKKYDSPRAEPILLARPHKYKRIKTYCDADDSDDEPVNVDRSPAAAAAVDVDATPGLDPDRSAGERNAGPSTNSAVQPTMNEQSNEDEYEREKERVYYNFEKIPCANMNQDLLNYLQQFEMKERKESLEKIFTLCYQKAQGCLQTCKQMMEQLMVSPNSKLEMCAKYKEIGLTEFKLSTCKDVEEKMELVHKNESLNKIICNKYIELFGEKNYELDNEVLDNLPIVLEVPKFIMNCKSYCRVIKVKSLTPSLSPSIDHVNQGSPSFVETETEIKNLERSMQEFAREFRIRSDALELMEQICNIISVNDNKFSMDIIDDLALYFLNNDFLLKYDGTLWKSSTIELIGELIMKLARVFDNSKNNMAYLSGCLICVFRAIVKKSSIPSNIWRSKFNVFMDLIRKLLYDKDRLLWKVWFVPKMFLDWCSVLVNIFMADSKIVNLQEMHIINAKSYFMKIKRRQYTVTDKTMRSVKSGIFEFSKSDDILDVCSIDINAEKICEREKEIETIVKQPLVKKLGSEIETKIAKEREELMNIGLVDTNSVKKIEAVKKPLVKTLGSEIEAKSAKKHEECEELLNIGLINTNSVVKEIEGEKGMYVIKEPLVKNPGSEIEAKSAKRHKEGVKLLINIGLINTNSVVKEIEGEKVVLAIKEPLVKTPGSEVEAKSAKKHEECEELLLNIGLINTNSVKEIEAVKEPLTKKPGSEVETKSVREHEPIKIKEIVDEPQLVIEPEHGKEADLAKEPSELCKKLQEDTTKLSPPENTNVLKSTCITKETKKNIHVSSMYDLSNTFEYSPYSLLTRLTVPQPAATQNIENINHLNSNDKKKTTLNNMTMEQSSTQNITEQNESVAFFTLPNNPHKYHINNSVPQTNVPIMQLAHLTNSVSQTNFPMIQPHPPSTNGLATVFAQSSSSNTPLCPINTNGNISINNTQAPNAYVLPSGPQVTSNNNFAQNYYFNDYYNNYSNGICQPNLINNTFGATNIVENQFVPSTQGTGFNTSTLPHQVHPYDNTSVSIKYSRNYTQITPKKKEKKKRKSKSGNMLLNSTVPSRVSSTINSVSIIPSNGPNHQSSKSVIVPNTYANNYLTTSTYQPPEHISQTSPDLPNAQSPNMPLQSNSNSRTLMHQKCTNADCCTYLTTTNTFDQQSINCCSNGHYCSTICQNSDLYYHQNECYQSQTSSHK